MGVQFPNFPTSGKNSKIFMNTSDGIVLNSLTMTLQESYKYKGKVYANRAYKLGSNQTLVNMRPEKAPKVTIDGILSGLDIVPSTTDNQVSVTAGIIEVDGVQVSTAETTLTLTRPSSDGAWYTVAVSKAGVLSVTKGTDSATLVNDYGSSAGEVPYTDATSLQVGLIKLSGTSDAPIAGSEIFVHDKELGGVDYQILPNLGVVLLSNTLVKCHTGGVSRPVKFTGYVLDSVLAEINTAKSFTITPSTSQISEETFSGSYSSSSISGYSFSYEQLAGDSKALDNAMEREGHCGLRLQWSNGFYMQFVGTLAPTLSVDTGSFNKISVSGSCGDVPARSDEV